MCAAARSWGLFGLVGAGRTELLESIFSLHSERLEGAVFVGGQPVRFASPADAIAAGLVLAPEDRKHDGLVLEMSVGANASLASLSRVLRFGLVDTARETAHVKPFLDRFRVKTPSLDQRIRKLSGGNQQKVLFRRFQSLLALGLMVLVLSLLSDNFLTPDNGWNILRQISVNACLSIGMTLVILSGGIDLSVGAILALSGAVAAGVLKNGGHLGTGAFLGMPMPVWITLILALIFIVVTTRTRFGRHLYAVGGNERAAFLTGLDVNRIKIAVYALAGVAGLLVTARLDSAQPNAGLGYELDSIAAVVIGGTSLSGGRGSITGTLLGCLIIGVLNNGLFLLNVSPFWQQVIKGGVILLAVATDRMNARNREF